jgi:hypothetical protein
MENAKITTLHPTKGKKGKNIDERKYTLVKTMIVDILKSNTPLSFAQMLRLTNRKAGRTFTGSFPWHLEMVKLDLEARNIIRRVPKTNPQEYELVQHETTENDLAIENEQNHFLSVGRT